MSTKTTKITMMRNARITHGDATKKAKFRSLNNSMNSYLILCHHEVSSLVLFPIALKVYEFIRIKL